jgi:hypothetical protein
MKVNVNLVLKILPAQMISVWKTYCGRHSGAQALRGEQTSGLIHTGVAPRYNIVPPMEVLAVHATERGRRFHDALGAHFLLEQGHEKPVYLE